MGEKQNSDDPETLEDFIANKPSDIDLAAISSEYFKKVEQKMQKVRIKRPSVIRLRSVVQKLTKTKNNRWYLSGSDVDLRGMVLCPEGIDVNAWLATNTFDFQNEVNNIWVFCSGGAKRYTEAGSGFPPGHEYRWVEEGKNDSVSGPDFIRNTLRFIKELLDDGVTFPGLDELGSKTVVYPEDFIQTTTRVFSLLFKVLSIVYHKFLYDLQLRDADGHLHMLLKHWTYFVCEHELMPPTEETEPLQEVVEMHAASYKVAYEKMVYRFAKNSEFSARS